MEEKRSPTSESPKKRTGPRESAVSEEMPDDKNKKGGVELKQKHSREL